jgi:hypothetical protein
LGEEIPREFLRRAGYHPAGGGTYSDSFYVRFHCMRYLPIAGPTHNLFPLVISRWQAKQALGRPGAPRRCFLSERLVLSPHVYGHGGHAYFCTLASPTTWPASGGATGATCRRGSMVKLVVLAELPAYGSRRPPACARRFFQSTAFIAPSPRLHHLRLIPKAGAQSGGDGRGR